MLTLNTLLLLLLQFQLIGFAAAAFAVATAIERTARAAFPAAIPPEKGGLVGPSSGGSAGIGRGSAARKED